MTGAPEVLLGLCSTILVNGTEEPLSEDLKTFYENAYKELGGQGETLIGFCDQVTHEWDLEDFPEKGLRFVGVMSLKANLTFNVVESVSKCRSAGIKIILATGEHPITAVAIARSAGIIDSNEDPYVVTGDELRDMSQREIDKVLERDDVVFARITPTQRWIIVEQCQGNFEEKKATVAAIGHHMQDVPSMKTADVGVALGVAGVDVCKVASDAILRDDDFWSLVMGIEEARMYFRNLKTNFAYNIISIVPDLILFALFFRVEDPADLNIVTILYIVLAALLVPIVSMMCSRHHDPNVMKRQPRNIETDTVLTQNLMLVAVIKKIATLFLSGMVAINMPSIILAWIALRICMSAILSFVAIRKISDLFPSLITLKDDMSLFPSIPIDDTNELEDKKKSE